jgi:hypothetical protein
MNPASHCKSEADNVTVKKQAGQMVEISSANALYPKRIGLVMKNPYEGSAHSWFVDVKVFLIEEQSVIITQINTNDLRAISRKDADSMLDERSRYLTSIAPIDILHLADHATGSIFRKDREDYMMNPSDLYDLKRVISHSHVGVVGVLEEAESSRNDALADEDEGVPMSPLLSQELERLPVTIDSSTSSRSSMQSSSHATCMELEELSSSDDDLQSIDFEETDEKESLTNENMQLLSVNSREITPHHPQVEGDFDSFNDFSFSDDDDDELPARSPSSSPKTGRSLPNKSKFSKPKTRTRKKSLRVQERSSRAICSTKRSMKLRLPSTFSPNSWVLVENIYSDYNGQVGRICERKTKNTEFIPVEFPNKSGDLIMAKTPQPIKNLRLVTEQYARSAIGRSRFQSYRIL